MFIKVLKASLAVGLFIGMAVAVLFLVHAFDNKQPKSESLISFHQECQIGCEDINSAYSDSLEKVASVQDRIHQDNLDKKKKAIKLDEESRIKREEAERKRLAELEKERECRRVERLKQQEEEKRIAEEKASQRRLAEEAEKKKERELAEKQERRRAERQVTQAEPSNTPSRGGGYQANYEATFYTSECVGCSGQSASGVWVNQSIYYQGLRVVAMPPSIPFFTKIRITFNDGSKMDAIVLDRGSDIVSGRIDILVGSKEEAYRLGRQNVKVEIIN